MTEKNAGAVATVVAQHAKLSSGDQNFQVFGQVVNGATVSGIDYVPLKPSFSWARGRNIGLASAYVQKLNLIPRPDVVEVHGRAQVARFVCQKRPDLPVILYLHNDPRNMKGAKTEEERLWLIKNLAGVICVSNYIKSCFLDGLTGRVSRMTLCKVFSMAQQKAKSYIYQKKNPFFSLAAWFLKKASSRMPCNCPGFEDVSRLEVTCCWWAAF